LRNERDFLAGLALGALIFKPQLGLVAAVVFVATRRWRVVAGAILSVFVQFGAAWLYYGYGPLREWLRVLLSVPHLLPWLEPRPYQTHCLRTFWAMLVPLPKVSLGLYILSAAIVLGLTTLCWRSLNTLSVRYSALLLATVVVAPHLTVYDLVILAPAFLLLGDWIIAHPDHRFSSRLSAFLYAAYVLPLAGPVTRWIHLQLSVLAMLGILGTLWQLQQKPLSNAEVE
jgi:hypothetical protein